MNNDILYKELINPDLNLNPVERSEIMDILERQVSRDYTHLIRNVPNHKLPFWLHERFHRYELLIEYVAFFMFEAYIPAYKTTRMLHSDLDYGRGGDFGTWQEQYAAMNYELTDYTPTMEWWDMRSVNVDVHLPPPREQYASIRPNGVHFGSRNNNTGIPGENSGAKLLARTTLRPEPVLIRTDVPHIVYSEAPIMHRRISMSIRFSGNPTIGDLNDIFSQGLRTNDAADDTTSRQT